MAATQEEVRELATRLQEARDVAQMQAQQIAELQSQAQRAQQDPAAGGGVGSASFPRADEFGANRTVDTRVLVVLIILKVYVEHGETGVLSSVRTRRLASHGWSS